jgi:competence protein ComEC
MVSAGGGIGALRHQFVGECGQRRSFLWTPVLFAAGILVYGQLPREPMLPALIAVAAFAATVAAWQYRKIRPFRVWLAIAVVASGALTAMVRVEWLAGPMLERPVFGTLEGTVAAINVRATRPVRIVLADPLIETRRPVRLPDRVRVSLTGRDTVPQVGQRIEIRARIGPVPGPAVPGGYDPRRAAFYQGIGASGFAIGRWQRAAQAGHAGMSFRIAIERARQSLVARIMASVDGTAGAVAAALLVGERGHIPEDAVESLRDAGLAHILAISGLHMALFAGTVFMLVRALLALSGPMSLTRPIKKWAALAAIFAAFCYLLLSGGNVATIRAFIMAAIMLCAVLVDRPALSLRNLAIAAMIILVMEPESVAEPGFQMSFSAVSALIAFYEVWRDRPRRNLAEPPATVAGRALRGIVRSVAAIGLTTLIAGLATGPVGAFYFNHVSLYSLLANLIALPVLSLVVMPAGLVGLAMMPFGLEALPLAVMAVGTDMILATAHWVSGLGGSTATVPSVSPVVYVVYIAGFFWICLWRLRWRWLGLIPITAAVSAMPFLTDSPDVLISNTGTMVAVRDESGILRVSARRPSEFVLEQWFEREGESVPGRENLAKGIACDRSACLAQLKGSTGWLAHVRNQEAFAEECRKATIIVTPLAAPPNCQAAHVIDKAILERFGAHSITISNGSTVERAAKPEFHVRTAYPANRRPWQGASP